MVRFRLDRNPPQLDRLSWKPSIFWGVFIFIYMKLLSTLKTILLEKRIPLGSFIDDDGETFNVIATDHSQIANTPSSRLSRPDFNEVSDVVFEYQDIISSVSKSIMEDIDKTSILIRDNWNGFDFILYPDFVDGEYQLNIVTSIKHPKKLQNKSVNKLIIITKDGDSIVKEQINNNHFTKIVKDDIIIYII
jgi:hypothetical protein